MGADCKGERMISKREKNAEIFADTKHIYETNAGLKAAVKNSIEHQKLILEGDAVCDDADAVSGGRRKERDGRVIVSGKRTLEASEFYAKQGKRVCVLNFASATNPGGGVVHGSSAQEEAICRCSTLYPCLNTKAMWNGFYAHHRSADNPLYNDDCIFTPKVKVFKSDIDFPEILPENEWWDVDVITCAAPNLRKVPSNAMNPNAGSKMAEITREDLKKLHESRIQRIFEVAMANDAEVLIFGAFGCGAFQNPPDLVASVFAEFTEKYRGCFDAIEYAVYHTVRETTNYKAFKDAIVVK